MLSDLANKLGKQGILFSDTRILSACLLRFFEIGGLVAANGYANLGMLSTYPLTQLPLYYFSIGIIHLLINLFSRKLIYKNPQAYTYSYFIISIAFLVLFYILIELRFPWTIFVGCALFVSISMQTTSVVANSISLAFDIREFGRVSHMFVISAGFGGIFFAFFLPYMIQLFGGSVLITLNALLYLGCLIVSSQLKPLHEQMIRKEGEIKPIKNRFFCLLLTYAVIIIIVTVLIDYTLKATLRNSFDTKTIGIVSTFFFGICSFLIIITQLYGQRRFVKRYGITNSLLLLPTFTIVFGSVTLFFPQVIFVLTTLGIFLLIRDGPLYIAYQILLNAIPRQTRILAKSQLYLYSSIIGRAALASPLLLLVINESSGIHRVVLCFILVISLTFILIPFIRRGYIKNLKKEVELPRFLQIDSLYSTENIVNEDIISLIPQIGRRYGIYDTLVFFKTSDVDPLPYLIDNLEDSRDIINFEGRVAVLGRLPFVEDCLMKLLHCRLSLLPDALPLTIAQRAMHIKFSTPFRQSIEKKLNEESQTVVALDGALQYETTKHLRLEIKSRLELAKLRFFYYFATLSSTREILNVIPKILTQQFQQSSQIATANALEYLETITESPNLRDLLIKTIENSHPFPTQEQYVATISEDPWLSKIHSIAKFHPGEKMNRTEKALFLRRVKLFEMLPAEILELISF